MNITNHCRIASWRIALAVSLTIALLVRSPQAYTKLRRRQIGMSMIQTEIDRFGGDLLHSKSVVLDHPEVIPGTDPPSPNLRLGSPRQVQRHR
jgi:hypothetical protein